MSNQTEEILEQNREQMLEGKTSKGKKIKPKYSTKSYANRKKKINPKPGLGTPDLKVSGDFHASIKLVKKGTDFIFKTDLGYAKKYVVPKYDDIFGLEPKRQKTFINEVFLEEYTEKIRKHLQI
jgi:hypothetical protein